MIWCVYVGGEGRGGREERGKGRGERGGGGGGGKREGGGKEGHGEEEETILHCALDVHILGTSWGPFLTFSPFCASMRSHVDTN